MEGFKQSKEESEKLIMREENVIENTSEKAKEKGLDPKKDYNFEAIKELEAPMENLVLRLKESIDKGEYDTIIGDDASGRIPTLALREVLSSRIREMHTDLTAEEDREKLKTYFIAGGWVKNKEPLLEFFKKIKPNIKKRALIITEYISSGRSILAVSTLLKEVGIPFDIATVAVSPYFEEFTNDNRRQLTSKGHNIFSGCCNKKGAPLIYGRRSLAGVTKEETTNYRAHRIAHAISLHKKPERLEYLAREEYSAKNSDSKEQEPEIIKYLTETLERSREDVNLLAQRILEKVWSDKK